MPAGVAPDFANQLKVSFKSPPPGSCLTPELLSEIASLLVVEFPGQNTQDGPCVSQQTNNLVSLDAENCIFVPGVDRYSDQEDFLSAAPSDITFTGWPESIDATVAIMQITPLFAQSDFATAHYDVVSVAADKVVVRVGGATQDAAILFKLVQNPVPPVQS